jgi:outer membrane receptor protein involved in Fe transport
MILTIIKEPSADYSVLLSSVYLQDEIRLSPKFNVLAGIRVDWQKIHGFSYFGSNKNTPEFAGYRNKLTMLQSSIQE